jgi:uncharacterized peroxidase-related enzyme
MSSDRQNQLLAALAAETIDGAAVTPRERALLAYADKLTLRPADMTAADVEALRKAGLDDRSIHDACAIVAYFAFVNRIADGLGVELESHMSSPRF